VASTCGSLVNYETVIGNKEVCMLELQELVLPLMNICILILRGLTQWVELDHHLLQGSNSERTNAYGELLRSAITLSETLIKLNLAASATYSLLHPVFRAHSNALLRECDITAYRVVLAYASQIGHTNLERNIASAVSEIIYMTSVRQD